MESVAQYKKRLKQWKSDDWIKKHPEGQYIIVRRQIWEYSKKHKRNAPSNNYRASVGWKNTRKTMVGVKSKSEFYYRAAGIASKDGKYQSGYVSGGKTTRYETPEAFLRGCKRYDVPQGMLDFFLELLTTRRQHHPSAQVKCKYLDYIEKNIPNC